MALSVLDIRPWIEIFHDNKSYDLRLVSESQLSRLQASASAWNKAMTEKGFAFITGHDIRHDLILEMEKDSMLFFQKEQSVKMQYCHGYYGHPLGGYTPPGVESVAQSNANTSKALPDPVENFVYCFNPKDFEAPDKIHKSPMNSAERYFVAMEELLRVLHRMTAYCLGLNDLDFLNHLYFERDSTVLSSDTVTEIDPRVGGERILNGSALRLSHYFPRNLSDMEVSPVNMGNDAQKEEADVIQYGEHTDYQGFTILRPDPRDWIEEGARGLQVRDSLSNEWIPVKVFSSIASEGDEVARFNYRDTFVVNAGDLIQRLTNDRWISAFHRVIGPVPRSLASQHTRQSIVFFTGPYEDVLIKTLPLDSADGVDRNHLYIPYKPAKYEPIFSGDHLRLKLMRSNV